MTPDLKCEKGGSWRSSAERILVDGTWKARGVTNRIDQTTNSFGLVDVTSPVTCAVANCSSICLVFEISCLRYT